MDGEPRICKLVRYRWQNARIKGAWSGPPALQLFAHALSDVAILPVLNVLSNTHFVADVMLGLGEVIHDYLAQGQGGGLSRFLGKSDKKVSRETFLSGWAENITRSHPSCSFR